jgi:hypothetical protein
MIMMFDGVQSEQVMERLYKFTYKLFLQFYSFSLHCKELINSFQRNCIDTNFRVEKPNIPTIHQHKNLESCKLFIAILTACNIRLVFSHTRNLDAETNAHLFVEYTSSGGITWGDKGTFLVQ